MTLPGHVDRAEVRIRLAVVFPEGTPNRLYCTREIAASTVFAMLYVGAVEGGDRWMAPKHVYKMSDAQAALSSDAERTEYAVSIMKQGALSRGPAWYADNSREPIRDETIRQGLLPLGAAVEKAGVATTASTPRYALTADFAALFAPGLSGTALELAISAWRAKYLTPAAQARIALVRAGVSKTPNDFLVTFPNGETRLLKPGPSSIITKQVVEQFAPRFLTAPGVLWLSESGNKVVARDEVLAKRINLDIDSSKNLPDLILVDLSDPFLLVFVEVVATDGAVTETRRTDLLRITQEAGIPAEQVAFVTAVLDRDSTALRKVLGVLAWGSFVWVASEPEHIIVLSKTEGPQQGRLRELLHG